MILNDLPLPDAGRKHHLGAIRVGRLPGCGLICHTKQDVRRFGWLSADGILRGAARVRLGGPVGRSVWVWRSEFESACDVGEPSPEATFVEVAEAEVTVEVGGIG